ncbi:hypothetical protein A2U01_0031993 [Trifolium medium]|uniref:Uncharacterized protein n=1 Tax=Trifolium medium TaxID=97028 RepID=A0A392PHW6_9FABA|nr:hypothetical protein [Trifolium medium]
MIGRANIEGSKSNVAMNAWLPKPIIHVAILALYLTIFSTLNSSRVVAFRGNRTKYPGVQVHVQSIPVPIEARTSTRVSSGFTLLMQSSPSSGSRQVCSHSNPSQKIGVSQQCNP